MLNLRFVVLSLVLVLACGNALVVAKQNQQKSGDSLCITIGKIELVPPEGVEPKKSPVEFPHSKHFTYTCRECHHKWDLSAEVKGCMTSGCHDLVRTPKKSEKVDAIRYFKKAYHQNCIGCHRQIKKQNLAMEKKASIDGKNIKIQKTGPTGCLQCHPKE